MERNDFYFKSDLLFSCFTLLVVTFIWEMFNFILSVRETFQLYKLKTATNALDLNNLEHYDFFVNVKYTVYKQFFIIICKNQALFH